METNGIIMEAAENVMTEGSKIGKGTKYGLVVAGAGLVALGVYKTVKFLKNKKESEVVDVIAEKNDEDFDAEI